MLNIWGVMLFIRMTWIVGQAGIGRFGSVWSVVWTSVSIHRQTLVQWLSRRCRMSLWDAVDSLERLCLSSQRRDARDTFVFLCPQRIPASSCWWQRSWPPSRAAQLLPSPPTASYEEVIYRQMKDCSDWGDPGPVVDIRVGLFILFIHARSLSNTAQICLKGQIY